MTEQTAAEPVDFTLLDETAKKLLGYYVYRKFRTYLGSITAALHQQYQDGLSEGLTRPTPRGPRDTLRFPRARLQRIDRGCRCLHVRALVSQKRELATASAQKRSRCST